jgi:sugar O-acyltransferase (sialic acid O-acetyltransferase NeuD family)
MPDPFLVIGAGGHAKVVIDALLGTGNHVVGCFDDNSRLVGTEPIRGIKVVGPAMRVGDEWKKGTFVIVAIGENRVRREVALRLSVDYGMVVAPSAILGRGVTLGPGTMVLPSATVNIDSAIGGHVILNTGCSVDHDCRIGDYSHVAPGCCLGGDVVVGEGSFLGIGTRVLPGIRIGRWSVVGAGAVVTRDLPDNCTAVGLPARVIKTRPEGWHLER